LPDRAHSGPLDVSLAGGVGAGVLYVGLLAFLAHRASQVLRRRDNLGAGVAAAVIAYGVNQLFLFPLAELDPVMWLFGGVLVTLTSVRDPSHARPVLALATSIAGVAMLVAGVLDVAADRQARNAMSTSDADAAINAAERAVTLRPDNVRYRLVAAETHLRRGTLVDIRKAIRQSQRAIDWSANDPFSNEERAMAMSRLAEATGDGGHAMEALAQWQRLVDRDPYRASWQLQLGRAAALVGDEVRAGRAWTMAASLGEPGAQELLDSLDAAP
ncbi:MAG TPA: hypothetical protein VH761_07255, partial [Ilumatobacteraceae bacterium]